MTNSDSDNDEESATLLPSTPPSPSTIETHSPRLIVLILVTIAFILNLGGYLTTVPSMRLYEDIICHHYYDRLEGKTWIGLEGNIDESLCKVDEVQTELNVLIAGQLALTNVPGILTAIPYGLLADRIGRKPVFALSILGLVLTLLGELVILNCSRFLPLRLIWLSPMVQFIGGGDKTASSIFFAIISDVMPQKDRANVFLIASCAAIFAEIIAPSVASNLMKISPWIPIYLGLGVFLTGLFLVIFIPETLHLHVTANATLVPDSSSEVSIPSSPKGKHFFATFKSQSVGSLKNIYDSTRVLHSLPVLLLLLPFIIGSVGQQALELSVLYISKRFSWTLSKAGFLLSLRAVVNIILLLVIIPLASHLLIKKLHFTTTKKDLLIGQLSGVFLFIGPLIIGASPTVSLTIIGLAVYTLGTGMEAIARSLITTLVDQQHVGRLYAAIAVVKTTGSLLGGPAIASLYSLGLKWKGAWLGLPFFGLAAICFIGALGIWCFGLLKRSERRSDFVDNDGEEGDRESLLIALEDEE